MLVIEEADVPSLFEYLYSQILHCFTNIENICMVCEVYHCPERAIGFLWCDEHWETDSFLHEALNNITLLILRKFSCNAERVH